MFLNDASSLTTREPVSVMFNHPQLGLNSLGVSPAVGRTEPVVAVSLRLALWLERVVLRALVMQPFECGVALPPYV